MRVANLRVLYSQYDSSQHCTQAVYRMYVQYHALRDNIAPARILLVSELIYSSVHILYFMLGFYQVCYIIYACNKLNINNFIDFSAYTCMYIE